MTGTDSEQSDFNFFFSGHCLGDADAGNFSVHFSACQETINKILKATAPISRELLLHIFCLIIKILWTHSLAEFQQLQVYNIVHAIFFSTFMFNASAGKEISC